MNVLINECTNKEKIRLNKKLVFVERREDELVFIDQQSKNTYVLKSDDDTECPVLVLEPNDHTFTQLSSNVHLNVEVAKELILYVQEWIDKVEQPKTSIIRINGKVFRCSCGSNCFHHPNSDDSIYECNACKQRYKGE